MATRHAIMTPLLLTAASAFTPQGRAATAVDVSFPTPQALVYNSTNNSFSQLGLGGEQFPGAYYTAGTRLTQTATDTGLPAATRSRWRFSMTDRTWAGTLNSFELEINGASVGQFGFIGDPSLPTRHFDIAVTHHAVTGASYTLNIVATRTVQPGAGSWNWMPGGTVELSAAVPEPQASAMLIAGLLAVGLYRRQRTQIQLGC